MYKWFVGLRQKYEIDAQSGCWVWQACLNAAGYGHVWDERQKKLKRAHRLAYELYIGPIPDGLVLDHLCGNKACVNPAHLEPVTVEENLNRSWQGASGEKRRREISYRYQRMRAQNKPKSLDAPAS